MRLCSFHSPEGTISRLATRPVLELLRPDVTVTLCLPLFLTGNDGECSFARTHPTITVDVCAKQYAKWSTGQHSGPVIGAIVVSNILGTETKVVIALRGFSPGMTRLPSGPWRSASPLKWIPSLELQFRTRPRTQKARRPVAAAPVLYLAPRSRPTKRIVRFALATKVIDHAEPVFQGARKRIARRCTSRERQGSQVE